MLAECGFSSEELLQAKAVGAQVVLQLFDAVLHIGPEVVFPPDSQRRGGATGNKDAKCVAGYVDELSADAAALLTHTLAHHDETPCCLPVVQTQLELADCIVVIHCRPLFNSLCLAFDPLGQSSHYNVGQAALLQKAQQLVVEETGIGSDQADLLALLPQREGFFEKLHHSPAGSAVAAAEPAVENEMSFGQHREQRMGLGRPCLRGLCPFTGPSCSP